MVKDKVKEIVESMGLPFQYNDWTRVNVEVDFTKLPLCVFVLPVSGQLYNKHLNIHDWPNCLIAFLDLAEMDFDGEENENTVDRMKKKAFEFVSAVNNSNAFEPLPDIIPYSVVYDYLDDNLTGIVLDVQLKERVGSCIK